MVHNRDSQTTKYFDFMCSAPQNYRSSKESTASPLGNVGISKVIHELFELHVTSGSLPWKSYFEPISTLLYTGFQVDPELLDLARRSNTSKSLVLQTMLSHNHYIAPVQVHSFFESLSDMNNPRQFYEIFAPQIDAAMASAGFNWTFDSELSSYQSKPISLKPVQIAGFQTLSFPSPYIGGMYLISILNNLNTMFETKPLNWKKLAHNDPSETAKYLNRIASLSRHAKILASTSGDPKDTQIRDQVERNDANLLNSYYNNIIINQISDENIAGPDLQSGFPANVMSEKENLGDGFVLATDSDSLTVLTSLYMGKPFGAIQDLGTTGQLLNSGLSLFSENVSTGNLNVIAPGRRPLVPSGPIYLHSKTKKCGIRVGVGSSGGFWGLFDALQVITGALYFLEGSACTDQESTPPVPTLRITGDSSPSKPFGDTTQASNVNCLPAKQALASARVHLTSMQNASQQVEATMSSSLTQALVSLNWSPAQVSSKNWLGRVAIAGWNGYNLIAYDDTRNPLNPMTTF
ncbi:Glutathione hydrolase 7 [Cichlidogyrus casuarinus]|uniref:Glutathione hydrolase 7 n=1 Tax=Cichlidogyrus casuarinus TaxID=1844966 RepID=A0ABD2QJQ3_9PLAT